MQERTGERVAANRTLTAFTASVSHDLRAALQAVKGLRALLTDRYASVLDPYGVRFLDLLQSKSR